MAMKIKPLTLILCIGLCFVFAYLGSLFTPQPGSWYYTTLQKPSWNPPSWLFLPAWTVLFILMGTAFAMIVETGFSKPGVKLASTVFIVQLILNLCWSALFFGLRSPLYGFIEIVVLWLAILTTIMTFRRVSPKASYLLIPYIMWVSFASFLNFTILQLNP
jgi:benzodiazapine receptor